MNMNLLDVLQERAGQDLTDSLMQHLHDREYENMLHLVCMRMHSLAHRSSVNVTLDMAEITDAITQKAYLAKLENDIRLLKNVQSYHVSIRAITSASAAVHCLNELLRVHTVRPRILSGLDIQLAEVPLPSDAEHIVRDFLVPNSQQANLALWTGLELAFSNTHHTDGAAPDFVRLLTALECLYMKDRNIVQFSPGYHDLRKLKKLSIGRRTEDGDEDLLTPRELPAFLNALPALEHLNISGFFEQSNDESKTVDLQHLVGLTYLDISDNYLMQVPESLSQLTNLQFLDLSRNSFDIAEIYWSDMSELRCLYVEEVRNDDGMPLDHSICHLHKLRELSCMSTRLHDLPDEIGNLVSLNFLQLTHCDLDELPESITRLTNLVELHAIGASFSSLPENFGNLRALEVIDFECNIDYIAIPPSFLHLTRLRKLTMPNTLMKPPGYDAFVTTLQATGCNYIQNS